MIIIIIIIVIIIAHKANFLGLPTKLMKVV